MIENGLCFGRALVDQVPDTMGWVVYEEYYVDVIIPRPARRFRQKSAPRRCPVDRLDYAESLADFLEVRKGLAIARAVELSNYLRDDGSLPPISWMIEKSGAGPARKRSMWPVVWEHQSGRTHLMIPLLRTDEYGDEILYIDDPYNYHLTDRSTGISLLDSTWESWLHLGLVPQRPERLTCVLLRCMKPTRSLDSGGSRWTTDGDPGCCRKGYWGHRDTHLVDPGLRFGS